ncbi:cytochrome P450 [Rhodococcus artemisiae]|uniref:Cytochrome P450 n=1 Tax=Rhodococcus artemisiae TaxID=714159 RepID=A0ABU7L9B9_9NOCA|nr:cytochrome P450 [Rhodococcus artemisiae]MEE2058146.1 cytochrome P450 [Rhodococcus artemisiae]
MTTATAFDPLSYEVQQDPYPYYEELRRNAPVQYIESVAAWGIFRYADVESTFKRPEIFSAKDFTSNAFGEFDPVPEVSSIIATDPPEHSRIRRLANAGFRPNAIKTMEPKVDGVIERLLDNLETTRSDFDLVSDFAAYVPVNVTADLLGVEDPAVREDFKRWTADLLQAPNRGVLPQEDLDRIRASVAELRAYFTEQIEYRRTHPGTDLISDLVRAEEEKQTLTATEILSLVALMQFGGSETPSHLISSTVYNLFSHPEILDEVRRDPSRALAAVQETLRQNSPVQMVFQTAVQDVDVAGVAIPAGSMVFSYIAAANHDDTIFDEPAQFILDRPNLNKHLSFATGAHHCIGAPLGRMMCAKAVSGLLTRFPDLRPVEQRPEWMPSYWVRGLAQYRFTA